MANWNTLFLDEKNIAPFPQPEVYKFVRLLECTFSERPLSLWDVCCGAGRHTVLIAQMGHRGYGSDISENGVRHGQKWLERVGLNATLAVADMTEPPFPGVTFHGAVSWDALHHNTMDNIQKAADQVYDSLCDGGMFMVSLLSTTSGKGAARGREIEDGTYVTEQGAEAGVPHHYFSEQGIRHLFKKWKILSLVNIEVDYIEVQLDFSMNPFPYTKWNVVVQK